MRGPLPAVTVAYVFGIIVAGCISLPLNWLFVTAFGLAIPVLSSDGLRRFLLLPFVAAVAAVNATIALSVIAPDDLRLLQEERTELCTIRGIIAGTPVYRVSERDSKPVVKSMTRVRVAQIGRKGEWNDVSGVVLVSTPGTLGEEYFAGRKVEVYGVLSPPRRRSAEGLFDYRRHLKYHGIYYQLLVEGPEDWLLRTDEHAPDSPPLSHRFSNWAHLVLARGLPPDDVATDLLRTMALGWKTALTDEVAEPFMQSGTLHVFAISGLHVALIAGILVSLAQLVRVPRAWCGIVVVPMLWFYTAATGWQASAIRSTIMMSVIIAGWALRRPPDLLNSLAAASLLILAWEPLQLFQTGFQLSFFVVLSIALLLPPLESWRRRLIQPDPFLPPDLRPTWQKRLDSPFRHITTSAATSTAAWLGSLPIVAYYFHLVTPVSLVANVLIVPLSGLALAGCMGSLICGDWSPGIGELFNHSAWLWMTCMVRISEWAAQLPCAYFYARSPHWAEFVIYYLALIAVASGWSFRSTPRKWASSFAALAIAGWILGSWHALQQTIRITILPLGGAGIHVDAPGKHHDMLVDCGNESSIDFLLTPFLRAQGVRRISTVVLSHGDLQHVGGFNALTDKFTIDEVVTTSIRFRSPAYRRLVNELAKPPNLLRQVHRGDAVAGWRVLHPKEEDRFSQADDSALVLYTELHNVSILLLSDLGKLGQRALSERHPELRADIVVTGLPTQGEPVEPAFLDLVSPKVLIVGTAEYPASSHAKRPLRKRLATLNIPVLYTSELGAISVEIAPGSFRVRAADQTLWGAKCKS